LEIIIISLEITRNNYFMARPSKVTEADKKSIAVRVANGVDMHALMKEYGFTTVKRIEQIAKEYGAKKNANAPLVDEYIENCQKNQAIINIVSQQGGDVGEYAFMEKVKQKLAHAKLTLLEKVSASRTVYEKVNVGEGIQNIEPREVGVQDAKEVKSLVDAVTNFSILVGATEPKQTTPTVAIQNNNSAEAKVENKPQHITEVVNGAFAIETPENE
jgi:hypothetical protein